MTQAGLTLLVGAASCSEIRHRRIADG